MFIIHIRDITRVDENKTAESKFNRKEKIHNIKNYNDSDYRILELLNVGPNNRYNHELPVRFLG